MMGIEIAISALVIVAIGWYLVKRIRNTPKPVEELGPTYNYVYGDSRSSSTPYRNQAQPASQPVSPVGTTQDDPMMTTILPAMILSTVLDADTPAQAQPSAPEPEVFKDHKDYGGRYDTGHDTGYTPTTYEAPSPPSYDSGSSYSGGSDSGGGGSFSSD